jgi:hypothetical protein
MSAPVMLAYRDWDRGMVAVEPSTWGYVDVVMSDISTRAAGEVVSIMMADVGTTGGEGVGMVVSIEPEDSIGIVASIVTVVSEGSSSAMDDSVSPQPTDNSMAAADRRHKTIFSIFLILPPLF